MKTRITIITALALAALLGGCIIYTPPDPDGPDFYHPAIPHTQVVHREFMHSDMEWVLWEYYDWDYDVVYNLHNRYKYTDDEICLILFLAYHGHCQPIQIVQWRQSGISWMTITTYNLRLQPDIFFVPVSPAYRFGPPYGHAYGRYWKNPRTVVLTDSEMVSLVYLKTTCLAYNASPLEVIKLHEQGRDFNQIVWVNRSEGRHIKTIRGRDVREPPDRIKIRPVEHDKPAGSPDNRGKPGRDKDKDRHEDGSDKGKPDDRGKPGLRPAGDDGSGGKDKGDRNDKPKIDTKPSKDKGKKDKPKTDDKSKSDDKGNKGKK